MSSLPSTSTSSFGHFSSSPTLPSRSSPLSSSPTFSPTYIPSTASLPPLLTVSPDANSNESPYHQNKNVRRSSSPTFGGDHTHNLHQHQSHSVPKNISPQLMSIQEVDVMVTPTSSPMMRGRFVGGMKKIFRLPSSGQAGVATSGAQAYIPTNIESEEHPHLEHSERTRIFRKVMKQIKRPHRVRYAGLGGLRRPVHRKRAVGGARSRERPHYSDDGYTSDPGLLREVIRLEQVEDQDEEEDTESGDRDGELRAERIARIQMKLEHYKKLLQEEENTLQEVENEYVVGMEVSVNDKDQQKIKKSFINKQSKAKDGIDQLKKKVERYEEQLNYLQQGGQIELTRQPGYSNKVRDQFNRIRTLGGVKNGIRRFRKKKRSTDGAQASMDIEDEEESYPDDVLLHHGDDDILCGTESQASFPNGHIDDLKDDQPCEYCLNEYHSIMEAMDVQKKQFNELQQQYSLLYEKLQQERHKTDRLESELNTLTDLHQNGVIELRGQLAQMERLTFSKSQDLEDTIDNCQSRLHKLEVQIVNTADRTERPVSTGMIRRIGVPFLSYLLDFVAVCFKLSEHLGSKTFITLVILLVAVIIFYVFYHTV